MTDLVKGLRAIDKDIILRRFDPEMSFDGMTAHKAADRIEKLEAALGGAYSWIDRWAKHVPNCRAPLGPCTCGRDAVMYETRKALEGKDG